MVELARLDGFGLDAVCTQARPVQDHLQAAIVHGQLDSDARVVGITASGHQGQVLGKILEPTLHFGLEIMYLTLEAYPGVVFCAAVQLTRNFVAQ